MAFVAELFWWFELVQPDLVKPRDVPNTPPEGRMFMLILGFILYIISEFVVSCRAIFDFVLRSSNVIFGLHYLILCISSFLKHTHPNMSRRARVILVILYEAVDSRFLAAWLDRRTIL